LDVVVVVVVWMWLLGVVVMVSRWEGRRSLARGNVVRYAAVRVCATRPRHHPTTTRKQKTHRLAEQLLQARRHGRQAELVLRARLRAALFEGWLMMG
jgi:hypothetical protein